MVDDPKKRLWYKKDFYFRIKAVDIFNLKALYTMMHEWFVEEEYCDDDKDFPEVYMRDRNVQNRGREILVHWRFHKHPFGINFYNRTIDVLIKMVGIKDIEVMQEGKKFKIQKGMFEMKVWAYLEYDAEEKWRNHWFLKHFLEIYVNRMNAKEFDIHRNELLEEVENYQSAVKEYLSLMKYTDKKYSLKDVSGYESPY